MGVKNSSNSSTLKLKLKVATKTTGPKHTKMSLSKYLQNALHISTSVSLVLILCSSNTPSCGVFYSTSPSHCHPSLFMTQCYLNPLLPSISLSPSIYLQTPHLYFLFVAAPVSPSNLHPCIIYISVSFPVPRGTDSAEDLSGDRTGCL